MHKLVLLFNQPEDPVDFDRRWSEEFVTVIESMPSVRRVAVGPAVPVPVEVMATTR